MTVHDVNDTALDKPLSTLVNIILSYNKECGAGTRQGFNIGTELDKKDVVVDGAVTEEYKFDNAPKIDALTTTTAFNLWLDDDIAEDGIIESVYFSTPVVSITDESVVSVALLGDARTENILTPLAPIGLSVVYTCNKNGQTEITITYNLGSYDKVSFTVYKSCGGERSEGMNVGLSIGSADIVLDGIVNSTWASSTTNYYVIPGDQDNWVFWISALSDYVITYDALVLSSTPVNFVRPYIIPPSATGPNQLTNIPTKIVIYFYCQKKGSTTILISFIMPSTSHVEFSFVKECLGKDSPRIDTSVWTANQLLVLSSVGTAFLAAIIFISYKKGYFGRHKTIRAVHHLRDTENN